MLTYTPETPLGTLCPDFVLSSVHGETYSLASFSKNSALLVMFICNHCPYVQAVEDRLLATAKRLKDRGVAVVAICSNDPTDYPEDAPTALKARADEKRYPFPYLVDSEQSVARAFGAVCTPDFFLFDGQRRLAYRGRLDDSWKDPSRVQKRELENAAEKILQGQSPLTPQVPAMGCSIKWKTAPP